MTNTKFCKICKKSTGKKIKLHCGRCQSYFHLECGKVSEVDARLMQQEKTPWECEGCSRTRVSLRRSTIYDVHSSDSDGIGELKTILKDMQSEIREMRNAMDFLNEKFEEERKRAKVMSDMFDEVSKDNTILKQRIEKLETALNVQQTNKIKNNLCISGLIKPEEKVSVKQKVLKLFSYLDPNTLENELETIKAIETSSGPKVLITVSDNAVKERILKSRSEKGRVTIRGAGLGEDSTVIYISEELTKDVYSLFKSAKQLKDLGYKYVWHRNGKIFARKQEGDKAINIKSQNTLSDLLK